jgi:hypothetical protein
MNGTMTVIATIGNVIGVGVSVPYTQELRRIGWIVSLLNAPLRYHQDMSTDRKVPVAIQFIPAIGIIGMVPFCPGKTDPYHPRSRS